MDVPSTTARSSCVLIAVLQFYILVNELFVRIRVFQTAVLGVLGVFFVRFLTFRRWRRSVAHLKCLNKEQITDTYEKYQEKHQPWEVGCCFIVSILLRPCAL